MNKQELLHSTLVPVDFTITSLYAIEHAAAIANLSADNTNNVVTLLHVLEGNHLNPISNISEIETFDKDSLAIEGAIYRLENIIQQHKDKYNVNFKFIVTGGKVTRTIAHIAEEIQAQSIVMGTHGSSGIQAFNGSNASRVIQIAPCPIVTIRDKSLGKGYKNIVLPLDLAIDTKEKVHMTTIIAKFFNSTVHIVTMKLEDEYYVHRNENNLKQVTHYLEDKGIQYTHKELDYHSSFSKETLTWSESMGADLIVIMADNDLDAVDYIFGTIPQQLVNKSKIPVMTVTPLHKMEGFSVIQS